MGRLIGISGKSGSGKSLLAELLQRNDEEYKIVNFADKLKEVCSLLSGLSMDSFNSQRSKKLHMPTVWDKHKSPTPAYNEVDKMTIRQFMQRVGTDALRDNVHEDIWTNALFADYHPLELTGKHPKWIIADVRFPNEAETIKRHGGIIIRISREQQIQRPLCEQYHPSEVSLDNYSGFGYRIYNDGTKKDLEDMARKCMETINLKLTSK